MILVLSDINDKHADKVCENLQQLNRDYFRINLDVESLKKTYITLNDSCLIVKNEFGNVNINQIKSIWARRAFVELTLEEKYDDDVDFKIWRNEWNKTLLGMYLKLKNCNWLGEINTAFRGENKYLQRQLASKLGFLQPKQIVSNDKKDLVKFISDNKEVVMKLMSQEFYETGDGFKGLYVNKITLEEIDKYFAEQENPIVLQEYVEKDYEVRYTAVGEKHFVCKINSQCSSRTKVDWRRYDIKNTPHEVIQPPDDIRKKVDMLLKELNLSFGALDFVVNKQNEWVFLEINTMGQWLWIETLTGLKISDAISEYLIVNDL